MIVTVVIVVIVVTIVTLVSVVLLVRGCLQIMSAAKGRGVGKC